MFKRSFILSLTFLFLPGTFCAQEKKAAPLSDEQIENLLEEKSPKDQIRLLDSLSGFFTNNDPNRALALSNKGLEIAMDIENEYFIGNLYSNRAKAYRQLAEYKKAIADIDASYAIFQKQKNKSWLISLNIDYGNIYYITGEYEKAVDHYLKAVRVAEETKDIASQSMCYNNLANIFLIQGQFDKAIEFYQKAYAIAKQQGNKMNEALLLDNIGLVYMNKGEFDMAQLYQVSALDIVEKLGNKKFLAEVLMNLGVSSLERKRFDAALKYFERTRKIYEEIDSKAGLAGVLVNIGETYRQQKQYAQAREALDEVVKITTEIGDRSVRVIAYENLSLLYEDKGDAKEALRYYKKLNELEDSILNEENSNSINELSAKYESEKKQQEIELLKKDKDLSEIKINNQRTVTISLVAGIVLILLLLGLMIYRFKEKQKANILLEEKNAAINEQKELVSEKNKEITDSINYAKRIQDAMLPSYKILNEYFRENFVFYQPKDIISGDFYWATRKNDRVYIAAADCTGHGVPGALMSMIGISFLRQVINEMNVSDPAQVLNRMHEMVVQALNEDLSMRDSKDGMDIALLMVDIGNRKAEFAGAVRPIYVADKSGLRVIKGDRFSIGGVKGMDESFTRVDIDLSSSTSFYMFSDGFADQFGQVSGKKFMIKRLQTLISELYTLPMETQRQKISSIFNDWKGTIEQTDDVLLMGLRV